MAEQELFEARLAEALRVYADRAPVSVDPLEVATAAATAAGPTRRWPTLVAALRSGSARFALILATLLLLLAIVIAALVGSGLIHRAPLPPNLLGFVETGPMSVSRPGLMAVPLQDGRVLVIGGSTPDLGGGLAIPYETAEIWDPKTGLFRLTGSMATPRLLFRATLLSDGHVLIEGGDPSNGATATAEIFDPAAGTWTTTGSMTGPRRMHTATELADGSVLVAGGHDGNGPLATAELYDPGTGTFRATGSLPQPMWLQGAVRLHGGKVLVAGGLDAENNPSAAAFLYDPATGAWAPTGPMTVARVMPLLTVLGDGRVLAFDSGQTVIDLYDPRTGTFTSTGPMAADHSTATRLDDGRVLAAGGGSGIAELYDPATGTFSATQPLNSAADVDAAVLLDDGRVLLVRGGTDPSELFDPGTPRTATGSPTPGASEGPSGPTPPDACSLITSSELTAIRGVAAGPGDPSAGSPSAPDCVWPRAGGTGDPLLEISISLDDPRIWAAIARSPDLRPMTVTDHNALEGGDGLWVEASPYIVRIAGVNPVAGGAATAAPEQQLAILERILARLR